MWGFQGEAPDLSSLLVVGRCARDGAYGELVSQPLSPASVRFPSHLLPVQESPS